MPRYDTPRGTEDVLRDHEEQLRRLANARTLENATIGQGGLVLDGGSIILRDGGVDKAVIGPDPTGKIGISVVGSAGVTTLDQIAFGTKVAKSSAEVNLVKDASSASLYGFQPSAVSYANTWHYLGPDITGVEVTGGRLTVVVGAELTVSGDGSGQVYFGAGLLGPGIVRGALPEDCISISRSAGMANLFGGSREVVFTDLPSGTYSIRPACLLSTVGTPGICATIRSRSVSARLI